VNTARTALRLFVYGTLKLGGRHHERLCRGVRSVESAIVRGRIYMLPVGYPVLTVPAASILARGSVDPLADVATQAKALGAWVTDRARWARSKGRQHPAKLARELTAPRDEGGDCDDVRGEILVFDDPEERLPRIDELEGFRPSGASLYSRVLLTVLRERDARLVPAWAYVEGELLRKAPPPKRRKGTIPTTS
jgi:gamma-glutamylcyclotransferase (GGCT)/AIG2-like uncharacterized protein YtfP